MRFLGSAGWCRVVAVIIATGIALAPLPSVAREALSATVTAAALPMEARTTLVRIHDGGPFPFSRDGVVFNNRERLLPTKPYGYYHEYTVPTPQSRTRGARRIVCGGAVSTLSECYYSDDHYRSFRKILP